MSDLNLPYLGNAITQPAPVVTGSNYFVQIPAITADTVVLSVVNKEDKANKGIANGYAPLDATSRVPFQNLSTIDVSKNIDDSISGVAATNTTKYLFSVSNPNNGVNPVFTRSSTCWARNIDTSPISVWTDGNGADPRYDTNAMTLISPRHVVMANHYKNNIPGNNWNNYNGAKVIFVAMDNSCHVRTLVGSAQVGVTDIRIGLLDSDLPASVSFCELANKDIVYAYGAGGVPPNSSRKPVFFQTHFAGTDGRKALIGEYLTGSGFGSYSINGLGIIDIPQNATRAAFYETPETGDSGRPVAFVVDNKLVLLFNFTTSNSGTNVSEYIAEINSVMASLGGGGLDVSGQISEHASATTSVHGITNTANLVTTSILATHNADTTAVHGIANTATLVVTSDSRLSDLRRPLPYPVPSETLFSGVMVEKRVHSRSYNSGDQLWETNVAVTQLPLVLDAYHNSALIYENGEEGWGLSQSPSVAFGTSNTSGLIFESDDEGAKIMRLGTIVIPPLPNPAPPAPYTTQTTFIESFSAIILKVGGAWESSAFASTWNSVSPSRNIFNSRTFNDQSETIKEWQLEAGYGPSYDSFNAAMASTNILLRCSKRYTSWTNGVSPSVEGNGNIIVEIIFYGTPLATTFGATAGTFCQGNDSRIANIKSSSINTKDATTIGYGSGIGGSINTSGKAKNENAGSPTPAGGNINTSAGDLSEDGWTGGAGGSINTGGENGQTVQARHGRNGGSIDTSAGGGAISTRGVGSNNGGNIDTSAGQSGSGGSINTSNGGGSISLVGSQGASAGSIFMNAGVRTTQNESGNGGNSGSINLSGANNSDSSGGNGGHIDLHGGTEDGHGGSILLNGNQGSRGGSITSIGGGEWDENQHGGSLNMSSGSSGSGGSIDTSNGGGSINTKGVGSIQLGVSNTRTTLNGSASATDKTITLPNETGTIALAPRIAYGGIISASAVDAFSGAGTYPMIQGSGVGGSIQVASNGTITIATAGTGYVDGQAIRAGGSRYNLVTQATQPASANLPIITKAGGGITTGTFGTTANSFCQGDDSRIANIVSSVDTRNFDGTGGYIKTSGDTSGNAGGYIDTSANNGGSNGGYINTTGSDGYGGYIDTRGSNQGYDGGFINTSAGDAQGGSINTTGGSEGAGGSINTSDGGGSINTSGGNNGAGGGGSINTSGLAGDDGGNINTSAGATGEGGSINTSNGGGSINTSGGGGGSILLTGLANQYFASNGGSIDLRALNAETSNGGSIIATGNYGYQGGTLNMSAGSNNNGGSINIMGGAYGDGGSINMSNNGGSINTSGVAPDIGGSINTSGGGSINTDDSGGDIDTSNEGGSINTSDGGGSINTKGVGSIQFGVSNTRTTLNGSASAANPQTITLPNATGTIALTNDARFGSQTIFTLGGEAKTVFALSTSYLHGCMPTRGPQLSGSYTSAVLKILGNFTVTGISIHQYLPSLTGATLTYQLVRVTSSSTVESLGSSVVVAGNNNLTTATSSISASLNSGDSIGLMLTLGASGTVPISTSATTILANIYCVPR